MEETLKKKILKSFFAKALSLFLPFIFLLSSCSTKTGLETLSNQSRLHLEAFVRYLFEETTAGYVLLGEKPLCICSLPRITDVFPGTDDHEMVVLIESGIAALNQLKLRQDHYRIIYRSSNEDANAELLILNLKRIKEVVSQNLPLFQSEFGSGMTVAEFVEKTLLNYPFSQIMKGQEALQGILLGYGVQNSLTFELVNHLRKAAYQSQKSSPPFKDSADPKNQEEVLCLIQKYSSDKSMVVDILKLLEDYGFCDPSNLRNPRLKIPFSYHKSSTESKNIISQYLKVQEKVDRILENDSFLSSFINRLNQ